MRAKPGSLPRLRGALMLVGEAVDHLAARVHEFHRAISDLPFGALRRVPVVRTGSGVVRGLHDPITDGVYGAIRSSAQILFSAADRALRGVEASSLPALPAPSADASRRQDDVVAAISGLVGDRMARRRNPLVARVGVYEQGERVRLHAQGLRAAFPQAGPRVVVFLHGLCGNENVWDYYRLAHDPDSESYGARLQRELGFTPLRLRYNSGLHVSLNGRSIARVLDRVFAHWPVPVQEIVLIGHSMGGLVARSAADVSATRGAGWTGALTRIVCLGTPHLGAPLEKAVHVGTHFMQRVPLSRPLARLLDARSHGIKDLRWGYTRDAEWKGRDPDAFWTQDREQAAPLPGVRYHFLGSCLTRDPEHPLSRSLGDGLVRLQSSLALDVAGADGAMRASLDHMRLLNHPDVYAQIRRWLSARS